MKKIITNAIVLYFGIVIAVFLFAYVTDNNDREQRAYENNKEVLLDMTSGIYKYAEYSTVGFKKINPTTPAKATLCGYTAEQSKLAEENSIASPCLFWIQMNTIQFDFHNKTIKARVIASDPVVKALDNVDAGFM